MLSPGSVWTESKFARGVHLMLGKGFVGGALEPFAFAFAQNVGPYLEK